MNKYQFESQPDPRCSKIGIFRKFVRHLFIEEFLQSSFVFIEPCQYLTYNMLNNQGIKVHSYILSIFLRRIFELIPQTRSRIGWYHIHLEHHVESFQIEFLLCRSR